MLNRQSPRKPVSPGLTRRALVRGLGAGALVLLGGGVAWLGGRKRTRLFAGQRAMMGTRATILLAHEDSTLAEALVAAALDRMEAIAAVLTRFDPGSEIGRANALAGERIAIGHDAATVIQTALSIARASDGAFDPGLDRLSTLWGFHDRAAPAALPTAAALAPWRGRHAHRAVELTWLGGQAWLRIRDAAVGLDLGGIAKGYAIDQGVALLRAAGARHALVEAGGDLYALGSHPGGGAWPVGVRHPRDPKRMLAVLSVRDEGVATSGDYERYFERDGQRYGHLIDPGSARPAPGLRSLTVRAPSAMLADAWATAGFVARPEAARALLRRVSTAPWLAVDSAGRVEGGSPRAGSV